VVRDFVNSCRKYGVKPGLYLGIRWNSFFGVHNFQVNGEGEFRYNRQAYYNRMVEGMLKELCTRYGDLFEIWFDGGADHPDNGVPDVLPIVEQYQPDCLFYHNSQLAEARWGGSESGTVPYPCWATFPNFYSHASNTPDDQYFYLKHGDPKGHYWMPAMSDAPLRGYNGRHEWFWEPGDEEHIFPLKNLMDMYLGSVGRYSTLIIGVTPDDRGLIPDPDTRRLKEWGDEIQRRFGHPVAATGPVQDETKIEIRLGKDQTIQTIVLQEDIRYGERIRSYRIDARVNHKWVPVGNGTCVGHKRIQEIEPVKCDRIRVVVTESDGPVRVKDIAVY
jgi:alpha-L-fucosidase